MEGMEMGMRVGVKMGIEVGVGVGMGMGMGMGMGKLCLATIMDTHLVTSDNQFGFKQKHILRTYVFIRLNLLHSIKIIIMALCILVYMMPLRPLTV